MREKEQQRYHFTFLYNFKKLFIIRIVKATLVLIVEVLVEPKEKNSFICETVSKEA
jgi:hypothetical protein